MRTTRRPERVTRIVTAGPAAGLATGLVLTGCAATADSATDRAAGAAGGQSPRADGGPGRATSSPPSAWRGELSSPAAPHGAEPDGADEAQLRGFAAGPAERRHPAHDNVRHLDLSPANAVSAS